ncbi:MAG: hypothetical protein ACO3V2_09230 [Ilumatobacteraceae bacterium]
MLLPTVAALVRIDPAHEEVARSLGHRPLSVLWRVTLPQVRPAVAAMRNPRARMSAACQMRSPTRWKPNIE